MMSSVDGLRYTHVTSPIGELLLLGDGRALHGLSMQDGHRPAAIAPGCEHDTAAFDRVRGQLSEYFAGERTSFELELALDGTPFQRRVWHALHRIAYGETISYAELARRVDPPSGPRAVGLANGRNPIAVIVPCHRVIGADGSLTGYGGGLERKRRLLDLETATIATIGPRLDGLGGGAAGGAQSDALRRDRAGQPCAGRPAGSPSGSGSFR